MSWLLPRSKDAEIAVGYLQKQKERFTDALKEPHGKLHKRVRLRAS